MKKIGFAILTTLIVTIGLFTTSTSALADDPSLGPVAASSPTTDSTSSIMAVLVATQTSGPHSLATGSGPTTITCTLYANQRVHNSTHVGGTVNWVTTLSCTAPVAKIKVTPTLFPPIPFAIITGAPAIETGVIGITTNVATTYCGNGNYHGSATATVTWPPNYTPSPQTWTATGNNYFITCDVDS